MRNHIRSLLLAFVAFAVPAHGYAAAAMVLCGLRHAPAVADAALHHAEASGEAPCHGDGPLREQSAACDSCSSCAALSVPAIAPGNAASAPEKAARLEVPFRAQGAALHVPDGPERPPRTTSR